MNGKNIGYIRVSSIDQNTARQLEGVPLDKTFTDTCSGKEAPFQKLQLQIIGAVAQFQRAMIKERQREGIAIAKAAGKYKGRKPSFSAEQAEQARQMVAAGQSKTDVARHFGVSRTTLYKVLTGGQET